MTIQFYRRRKFPINWRRLCEKSIETTVKALMLFAGSLLIASAASGFWYFVPYRYGWHFSGELELAVLRDWIYISVFFYGLLAMIAIESVWGEYKEIRKSIKDYNFDTFMRLRREDLSPLMHALMCFPALVMIFGFMGLEYPNPWSGMLSIGMAAYLPALIFLIVIEIDNPLVGIWFIRHIHDGWLETDVYEWRKKHYKKMRHEKGDSIPKEEREVVHDKAA